MRKLRLVSKIVTSKTQQQIISIHILPNILRSKGYQAIKFNQLIEYNMKVIFLEKPCSKCSGEVIPTPFYKKWPYLCISSLNVIKFILILCSSRGLSKFINLRSWLLSFILYKAFLKNKKSSGTSLSTSVFAWFLKKNIFHVIFCITLY